MATTANLSFPHCYTVIVTRIQSNPFRQTKQLHNLIPRYTFKRNSGHLPCEKWENGVHISAVLNYEDLVLVVLELRTSRYFIRIKS